VRPVVEEARRRRWPGRRRRSLALATTTLMSLAGLVVMAPAVSASHEVVFTITCTGVTFHFEEFGQKTQTVQETVSIDGTQVASQSFTFTGPHATNTISISVGPGTHTVTATVNWDTNKSRSAMMTLSGCAPPPPTCTGNAIVSNFNGTAIPGGDYIWFNSVFKPTGVASGGGTVTLSNAHVTFSVGTTDYTVPVPDAVITFSPSAGSGSTSFNGTEWVTTVPSSFSDNVFLSGVAFPVPASGLAGGINPVTWTGDFTLNSVSSISWQWAAAVYTTFSTDYNSLGVKPLHSTSLDSYNNGDQAGTPENFKSDVTGGARGGGGANATGSYSPTGGCAG
jgi:hypothetical protein